MVKKILPFLGVFLYLILVGVGFWLLHTSQTGASLTTPWQTIDPRYIYIFAGATFVLGLLIFSRLKSFNLLILLIFHSFFLHSYLPLTHQLMYGADGWRHMANEERILAGLPFLEPQIVSQSQTTHYSLLTTIGRLSYSQLWFLSAAVSDTLPLDLITVNKWLLPVVWSLFFPLLLFEIGKALGWGEKQSLFLVWVSALPFALQSAGSFTLPVNLGFLVWLLFFLALLKRANKPEPRQIIFLLIGAVVLLFGYSLFFIVYLLAWGITEALSLRAKRSNPIADVLLTTKGLPRHPAIAGLLAMTLLVALVLPGIELFSHYSYLTPLNWFTQIKQIFGNFTGLYLANGPRPHDIATGNIIFNQTPSYAFVSNWFTLWRGWVVVFMIAFWFIVLIGIRDFYRRRTTTYYLLLTTSLGFTGSYILSRYFLSGEEVLTRRLDVVLAFFFIILFTAGFVSLYNKISPSFKKFALGFILLILTVAIAASYSLGPDTNTVSFDEYQAMQYVWANDEINPDHCVVADTYPLLALEAISKKEIIGGGFPIDANFGQPELVKAYQELKKNLSFEAWRDVLNQRKLNECWLVASRENLQYNAFMAKDSDNIRYFGDIVVWRYVGPSESVKNK
jgi:hypothetical protein